MLVSNTLVAQGAVARLAFPDSLVLSPTSRWPTTLPPETVRTVLDRPLPAPTDSGVAVTPTPRASVVVVTYNNLVFTRLCLESVLANTSGSLNGALPYEIVVVDNGSSDGTPEYLRALDGAFPHVSVCFNRDNRGFAPANNQGILAARGDVLVLLNNDTMVPPGWLEPMLRHLEDDRVGMVGPTTNRTCNEAQIATDYHTYGELVDFALCHTRMRTGETFDVRMLAMFCLALRRDTQARIGPLDERYEVGMFEDDDYAIRARAAGFRVVCAEDAFVHHFGQASIGQLAATGTYGALFDANRRRFEEKWGIAWQPHARRADQGYADLLERIREVVRSTVPQGAAIAVVSKGDDSLLDLEGRPAWHFPQDGGDVYAGYHPASSEDAIGQLEELRVRGAEYVLFPSTASWWLEHYSGLKHHLESRYREAAHVDGTCRIYALRTREMA